MKKKKHFYMMQAVKDFMREQSGDIKQELNGIIWRLEMNGTLEMPYGEKISGENLFAIRVIQTGNIRVFYVYGVADYVFGIHAYTKKTQAIPEKELNYARKVVRDLQQKGVIK
ncbi:MAG: hypothetical protein E7038_04070 [Lentisphaerae bacterium]|nr:hypothetical protein [Lentisphaerota bacterium]